MRKHRLLVYHRDPLMGSTVRDQNNYAYHTSETPAEYPPITETRQSLCRRLGFSNMITLHQTHSTLIHRIDEENVNVFLENPLIEGDGLWTTLPDVLLGVFTADCLPIFFHARDVIGVVHAGRKGVYGAIHVAMVEQLQAYGYVASELRVTIGPHIRACCYEVGEDVLQGTATQYAIKKEGKWHLDLEAMVIADLRIRGVHHATTISVCTFCSDSRIWYSYRRGERHCRHLHFIGKRKI